MLTRLQINDITTQLHRQLRDISIDDTKLKPKTNSEVIALELFTAQVLRKQAEGRYKNALALALDAGIIHDYGKKPMEGGTSEDVYIGHHVKVHVDARHGSTKIDAEKLVRRLLCELPSMKSTIESCIYAATTTNRPAHVITVELRGMHEVEE